MALVINSSRPAAFQRVLPAGWIIEAPTVLHTTHHDYTVPQALILSRFTCVNLSTLCSTVLLLHIYASCWFERRYSKSLNAKEGERTSVPRNEGRRALYYGLFTIAISTIVSVTRAILSRIGVGIWQRE
jgi:dolichol kinase